MRCSSLVERNGYFTGRRCSRTSTFKITNIETGEERHVCTVHKNQVQRREWWRIAHGKIVIGPREL